MGWFTITADNGWCGTVAEIRPVCNRAYVLLTDATLPAPNTYNKTEDRRKKKLVIRCWQRPDQLNFKVGDVISCDNIDIDTTDMTHNCSSGENGYSGTFTVLKHGPQ